MIEGENLCLKIKMVNTHKEKESLHSNNKNNFNSF